MRTSALTTWVDKWAMRYPVLAEREKLGDLYDRKRKSFRLDQLEIIYRWKYARLWPDRKVAALRANCDERQARDWTRRAISCPDDLGALAFVHLLPGANAAGGSAILTVADQKRFTVMDRRAIKSLVCLGQWDPTVQGTTASATHWIEYLRECRKISERTNRSLRTVDHALYQSRGRQ